jgi:hypothetical protein
MSSRIVKRSKPNLLQPPLSKTIYHSADGVFMEDLERLAEQERLNALKRIESADGHRVFEGAPEPTPPAVPGYMDVEANTALYHELRKFLQNQPPIKITRRYRRIIECSTAAMRLLSPEDLRFTRDLARLGFHWVHTGIQQSLQKTAEWRQRKKDKQKRTREEEKI